MDNQNKSTNQIQNSKSKTKSISPLSLLLYRVWWRLGFDDRFVPLASQLLLCSKDHSLQRPKNFHCICAHKTTNSLGFLYPSLDHLSASLFVSFFFHLWRLKIWLKRSVKCWIITSSLLLVLTMILLRFLRLIFSMPICCECNPLPIFSFPICFFCVYIVFWNWVWETWNKVIGFWVCTLSTVMVFLPYSIFTILRLNPTLQ